MSLFGPTNLERYLSHKELKQRNTGCAKECLRKSDVQQRIAQGKLMNKITASLKGFEGKEEHFGPMYTC